MALLVLFSFLHCFALLRTRNPCVRATKRNALRAENLLPPPRLSSCDGNSAPETVPFFSTCHTRKKEKESISTAQDLSTHVKVSNVGVAWATTSRETRFARRISLFFFRFTEKKELQGKTNALTRCSEKERERENTVAKILLFAGRHDACSHGVRGPQKRDETRR